MDVKPANNVFIFTVDTWLVNIVRKQTVGW